MSKIRKGDEVVVITGRDSGKHGAVLRVLATDRVVVQGVGVVKKHAKPNPLKGQVGGIIEKETPVHISNVALFNSAIQKGDRVGFKVLEDGRKVRVFKSSGEVVDA